ncbi:hypothetical protein LINPERPRIM_LOCUS21242, partial [Linum perenne]
MTGEVEDPSLLLSSQPSTKTSSSISSKSRRTHNGQLGMSATPWIIIIPQTQLWNTLGEMELNVECYGRVMNGCWISDEEWV